MPPHRPGGDPALLYSFFTVFHSPPAGGLANGLETFAEVTLTPWPSRRGGWMSFVASVAIVLAEFALTVLFSGFCFLTSAISCAAISDLDTHNSCRSGRLSS